VTLGVADGIGDLRTVLRQRFGDDVRTPLVGPERSLFGRARHGVALKLRQFGNPGLAEDLISTLEERALWSRYGL
jgi:serine protease SohB